MPRKQFMYLPFGRLLHERTIEFYPTKARGTKKDPRRVKVAKILGVPYQTAATWYVGNSIPGTLERKLAVGVFFGWYDPEKEPEDTEGIKRVLDYFEGDECKSSEEERAMHIRGQQLKKRLRSKQRVQKRWRARKKERE